VKMIYSGALREKLIGIIHTWLQPGDDKQRPD